MKRAGACGDSVAWWPQDELSFLAWRVGQDNVLLAIPDAVSRIKYSPCMTGNSEARLSVLDWYSFTLDKICYATALKWDGRLDGNRKHALH